MIRYRWIGSNSSGLLILCHARPTWIDHGPKMIALRPYWRPRRGDVWTAIAPDVAAAFGYDLRPGELRRIEPTRRKKP